MYGYWAKSEGGRCCPNNMYVHTTNIGGDVMKAIECATKAGEMVWKGWVESVEDQPNGNKVVRIRGNNAEAILEVPRELAVEAQLTPQSVVETISVPT